MKKTVPLPWCVSRRNAGLFLKQSTSLPTQKNCFSRNKKFTLIELLVVIAIITILPVQNF